MRRPRTLRSRIVLFFCGYLAVLLAVYSVALIIIFRNSQDMAFNRQLTEISSGIANHLETQGTLPDTLPMHVSAYTDPAKVPPALWNHVKNRKPGVFEINDGDVNAHAAIVPLVSKGILLFVFYDVGPIEASEELESMLKLVLVLLGLGILLLGWVLARSLSNRIITPVTELAAAVQTLPLDEEGTTFRFSQTPDEIGTLSETIAHLLNRISEFTRREREFTSHASHELRTPVTVIKGAMEILKGRSKTEQTGIRRPLARIERAVTDIELLIDTFLMLARQKRIPNRDEICNLQEVVENVVAMHRHLLASKPVEVTVKATGTGSIPAPAPLVTIALGNLIRNAFQYTMEGKISIIAFPDRVRIVDNGPGIGASRKEGGLGLTIVRRLCERMDWQLVLADVSGEGTRAELIFIHSSRQE